MRRSLGTILGWLGCGLFAALCALLAAYAWRAAEHNAFHRSRAHDNLLWAQLALAFPLGTPLEEVQAALGIDQEPDSSGELRIRPDLAIPREEWRDYRGYTLTFEQGRLARIAPVGPDGPGQDVGWPPALEERLRERGAYR